MFNLKEREDLQDLFFRAKEGSRKEVDYLMKRYSLKVWTSIEIKGLNYLIQGVKEMSEKFFPEREMLINLPHEYQGTLQAKVNWIDDIGEGFYLFGFTYENNGYPYDGGSGIWMMMFNGESFDPLFNTSEVTIQDLIEKAKRGLPKDLRRKEKVKDDVEAVSRPESGV